jgi:hypothetical protein
MCMVHDIVEKCTSPVATGASRGHSFEPCTIWDDLYHYGNYSEPLFNVICRIQPCANGAVEVLTADVVRYRHWLQEAQVHLGDITSSLNPTSSKIDLKASNSGSTPCSGPATLHLNYQGISDGPKLRVESRRIETCNSWFPPTPWWVVGLSLRTLPTTKTTTDCFTLHHMVITARIRMVCHSAMLFL